MASGGSAPRTFLITGAARGIGRGLSRSLLDRGHRVFLMDHDTAELNNTVSLLSRRSPRGGAFDAAPCDVRQPAQVASVVSQAAAFFGGRLNCLVNNAAYTGGAVGGPKLEDLDLAEWSRSIETNLTGPLVVTQACATLLRQVRGCVVHVSSTRARQSEPGGEGYAASKAGLLGLSQSMAVSLAGEVRVSAVVLGWIHAEDECRAADERGARWEDGLSEEDMRWQLTGRVGNVEDVVRAVVFLEESTGVTGAEVVVDGGVTRKMVYPE